MRARWIGLLVTALMGLMGAARAAAHPVLATTAVVKVERDGRIEVSVRHDALAFALNDLAQRIDDREMQQLLDGSRADLERALAEGRERFQTLFEVSADGVRTPMEVVSAPAAEQVEAWRKSGNRPLLPVKLEFVTRGMLPGTTKVIVVRFPEVMGDVVLTVQTPGAEPLGTMVRAGERSEAFAVALSAEVIPSAAAAAPVVVKGEAERTVPSIASFSGAMRFVGMGITHILPGPEWFENIREKWRSGDLHSNLGALIPDGADHILFVLGLFFLSPRVRPLLIQITAFTVAHSVTLALSARGVVNLPSSIVEPTIAASIAFVAVENLFTQRVRAWRTAVVFCFGLVHGLGFASAFMEAFGTSRIPLGPVLLFNVGVEIGQLGVVGLALLTVGWLRNKVWYRARVAIPASVCIACVGVFWTAQRIFF